MRTQEAELLSLTKRPASGHEDLTAVIVDFSAVPHISDPIFFRTLIARVNVVPGDLYRLPHNLVALVTPSSKAPKTVAAVEQLGAFLKRTGRGGARQQQFRLADDGGRLAKLCHRLMEEQPDAPPVSDQDDHVFGGYMSLFTSLRNADISNLVREQTIWDLSQQHHPVPMAGALTVSIDALDDMFAQNIRANPWLFEKIIEVIDVRMLDHLVDDRLKTGKTFTVNVNSTVVNEGEFEESFAAIPISARSRVILEVPYVEALHERPAFDRMVSTLEQEQFPVALDGIRWNSLPKLEVDHTRFDFIKFMWDRHLTPEHAKEWASLETALQAIGPERCIVFNCIEEGAIEALKKLGLFRFQGHAVNSYVRHARKETAPAADRKPAREAVADETGNGKPQESILGKLFG
ncbi:hypothetical protein NUH88_15215 [Nisaea acidiphila]|uniref:EAL domain-containing protein n=1 Tax=Nisaea acidiphila TaxID=1862145 RepID=A0A9J7ANI5_9PROT|nr:hypothetical protein [Nisaea acidiphila]UUX48751.1 hypothetical protein NUH88_15215 [Nisaea acidiphila]